MSESIIKPNELLHRAIEPNKGFWLDKEGRISSSLFKDSNGVSVDINADRTDDEVKEAFLHVFSALEGEARLSVQLCLDNNCNVQTDPSERNPYHTLILGKNKAGLTSGQAKQLAKNCQFIRYD
ncbi:MAG: hypothetical protein WAX77_15720 [Methylococcaceae bacterium]